MDQERIEYIEKRLLEIESEKAKLADELAFLKSKYSNISIHLRGVPSLEEAPSGVNGKISLFLWLFRGRKDLYSRLWENARKGTKGFSPACSNEWIAGVCRKPSVKCHECPVRKFEPFDEKAARSHLEGKIIVGSYAINTDDTCVFLAADFDGKGWREDVQAMLEHDYGVLVAPPGIGKTVMACALLAERGVPTLVLVHRKQLIEQWKTQIMSLLGIEKKSIGVLGGTGKKVKGFIDIAMMQTIVRMKDASPLKDRYGMIIIDECHHVPAVSFESVLALFPARYVLGLTATPYRKDGLQPIIHMQCGPVRHTMIAPEYSILDKKVIVRESFFSVPEKYGDKPAMHEIWEALVNDDNRQRMIAEDVKDVLVSGRFPLIISDRKEHLASLSNRIKESTSGIDTKEFMLIGDMGKKARKKVLEDISALQGSDTKPYILSTASLIGEGFDLPELDTLFSTMPVSFKGRVVQYAGRLHHETAGKHDIVIYDYCDSSLGLTLPMFKKRISAYREIGYEIILPESEKIVRLVKKPRYSGKSLP